jgi:hypothetical protein
MITFNNLNQRNGVMGNKLKPWNRLLGLAFHAIADHLGAYETSGDSWHTSAINGHSHFSKVFHLTNTEGALLKEKSVYTMSQLLEVNDLTGHLTYRQKQSTICRTLSLPLAAT